MTLSAGSTAALTAAMSAAYQRQFSHPLNGSVEVPCRSLTSIMADAGLQSAEGEIDKYGAWKVKALSAS